MSKITLSNVADLTQATTAEATINSNFSIIQSAMDNTLSRDGTVPNTMGNNLDMNNFQIVNLPSPITGSSPLRLQDANTLNGGGTIQSIPSGGTTGQALTKNSNTNYDVTWSTISSGGGGGNPTNFAIPPLGRLTLASGTPVMVASQAAKNTVYYTPYAGNLVPIYDGTNMTPTAFTELSQLTTDTTKSPAAVANNSVYDIFVWNDSGTLRATRGPAWTNSSTRGYTLTAVNGILLNTSSITNGPAALRGTWVGTIASNGTATIDFVLGSSGSGGIAANLKVWNAYNRVNIGTIVADNGTAYTYSSNTIRQARGSSGNQVSFVVGAQEDSAYASYTQTCFYPAVAQSYAQIAIGYDAIGFGFGEAATFQNAGSVQVAAYFQTSAVIPAPAVGTHTIYACEAGDGTNTVQFGNSGVTQQSPYLYFQMRM